MPADLAITIGEAPGLAQLEPVWRDLADRSNGSFYLSWHWIGPWLTHIARRPLLLKATAGGQVVALALLFAFTERRHGWLASRALCLHETGDPACDVLTIEFNGILHDRRFGATLALGCLRAIADWHRKGGDWDELRLGGVTEEFLPLAGSIGLKVLTRDRRPSAAVDLAAIRASGKSFLDHLSSNTRYQLRRSLRLYEKRGPLTVTAARDPVEARSFMAGLAELHQATWVARGKPGAFGADFLPRVHESVISASLPSGNVEVVRVAAGNHVIGYLYNFIYRGWVGAYLSGLAYEEDAKLKPGMVSHYLCAERHLKAGMSAYDFMAGDNRYKTSLGTPGPDMLWLSLQRPRLKLRIEDAMRNAKHRFDAMRHKSEFAASAGGDGENDT
ncbi:MAG TPA: GNAT family N-acetyltransferase [Candidatus Cybelea sp.]|nr:GNAT family N-acetyltransferase [Candidatus Cybelea sp.]